ncbi:MAG: substrate-binding domain-containing protein [Thermodesulfobacteriota bacterium]
MPAEIMNTKEVANYLGIHEKQVYALIKAKKIPATRVTGKWVFPKRLIDEWIEKNARQGMAEVRQRSKKISGGLLAAGSNDPILDMLKTYLRRSFPEIYIFSANTGSIDGLKALNDGLTDMAWTHLFEPETGEYNIPYLSRFLPKIKAVVVNLFRRELGFLVAPGNPLRIKGFPDLARQKIKFINRQEGSGTRVLLDYNLQKLQISSSLIKGYENEVYTHFEVGLSILSREADVGIATIAISKLLGLSFVPITQERFDMVLDQATFFDQKIQAFIEILNSPDFRRRVEPISNYDFKNSGRIIYAVA